MAPVITALYVEEAAISLRREISEGAGGNAARPKMRRAEGIRSRAYSSRPQPAPAPPFEDAVEIRGKSANKRARPGGISAGDRKFPAQTLYKSGARSVFIGL